MLHINLLIRHVFKNIIPFHIVKSLSLSLSYLSIYLPISLSLYGIGIFQLTCKGRDK